MKNKDVHDIEGVAAYHAPAMVIEFKSKRATHRFADWLEKEAIA